ncbi:NCA1 [Scenedesmus sp. PABB004]|nr:NCA1 [Scenedesmus sp. PABB004]
MATCPFSGAAAAPGGGTDGGGCPFAGAAAAAQAQQQRQQAAQAGAEPAPRAVCPLGFGSSRGPQLSSLHCPLCKALLHDACAAPCGHAFCRACIARARDCPVCGADVDHAALQPNAELTGMVDTFLDTHSRSPQLVAAAQVDLGPLPDDSAGSFFMAHGLRSLAGGNAHAALHRFERARAALLDAGATAPPPGAVGAACQLAAACGCLADCHRRLGDDAAAAALLGEAAAAVEGFADDDGEAAHALSVSLNKLGDLRYSQQALPAAAGLYRRALALREARCGPLSGGRAGPGEQLELAAALVKVSDAARALGERDEAATLLHRAAGVAFEVQRQADEAGGALPPPAAYKLQLLLDVLRAQQAEAASAE